jgi:hypothetical protein
MNRGQFTIGVVSVKNTAPRNEELYVYLGCFYNLFRKTVLQD